MKTQKVFDFIYSFIRDNGYSPSTRDIGGALGMVTSNVHFHLNKLEKAGRITKVKNISRSIQIVGTEIKLP